MSYNKNITNYNEDNDRSLKENAKDVLNNLAESHIIKSSRLEKKSNSNSDGSFKIANFL